MLSCMNSNNSAEYASYLSYLARNDPARTPMTLAEFVEAHDLNTEKPVALVGVADPMHY